MVGSSPSLITGILSLTAACATSGSSIVWPFRQLKNIPLNLTWGSFNDNWKDKIRHKSGVKLTPGEVIEIREMLTEGYSQATIAKIFSVSGSSIHFIAYGATWRRPEYGLTPEFIQWQRGYLGEGKQPAELVTVTRFERQAVAS